MAIQRRDVRLGEDDQKLYGKSFEKAKAEGEFKGKTVTHVSHAWQNLKIKFSRFLHVIKTGESIHTKQIRELNKNVKALLDEAEVDKNLKLDKFELDLDISALRTAASQTKQIIEQLKEAKADKTQIEKASEHLQHLDSALDIFIGKRKNVIEVHAPVRREQPKAPKMPVAPSSEASSSITPAGEASDRGLLGRVGPVQQPSDVELKGQDSQAATKIKSPKPNIQSTVSKTPQPGPLPGSPLPKSEVRTAGRPIPTSPPSIQVPTRSVASSSTDVRPVRPQTPTVQAPPSPKAQVKEEPINPEAAVVKPESRPGHRHLSKRERKDLKKQQRALLAPKVPGQATSGADLGREAKGRSEESITPEAEEAHYEVSVFDRTKNRRLTDQEREAKMAAKGRDSRAMLPVNPQTSTVQTPSSPKAQVTDADDWSKLDQPAPNVAGGDMPGLVDPTVQAENLARDESLRNAPQVVSPRESQLKHPEMPDTNEVVADMRGLTKAEQDAKNTGILGLPGRAAATVTALPQKAIAGASHVLQFLNAMLPTTAYGVELEGYTANRELKGLGPKISEFLSSIEMPISMGMEIGEQPPRGEPEVSSALVPKGKPAKSIEVTLQDKNVRDKIIAEKGKDCYDRLVLAYGEGTFLLKAGENPGKIVVTPPADPGEPEISYVVAYSKPQVEATQKEAIREDAPRVDSDIPEKFSEKVQKYIPGPTFTLKHFLLGAGLAVLAPQLVSEAVKIQGLSEAIPFVPVGRELEGESSFPFAGGVRPYGGTSTSGEIGQESYPLTHLTITPINTKFTEGTLADPKTVKDAKTFEEASRTKSSVKEEPSVSSRPDLPTALSIGALALAVFLAATKKPIAAEKPHTEGTVTRTEATHKTFEDLHTSVATTRQSLKGLSLYIDQVLQEKRGASTEAHLSEIKKQFVQKGIAINEQARNGHKDVRVPGDLPIGSQELKQWVLDINNLVIETAGALEAYLEAEPKVKEEVGVAQQSTDLSSEQWYREAAAIIEKQAEIFEGVRHFGEIPLTVEAAGREIAHANEAAEREVAWAERDLRASLLERSLEGALKLKPGHKKSRDENVDMEHLAEQLLEKQLLLGDEDYINSLGIKGFKKVEEETIALLEKFIQRDIKVNYEDNVSRKLDEHFKKQLSQTQNTLASFKSHVEQFAQTLILGKEKTLCQEILDGIEQGLSSMEVHDEDNLSNRDLAKLNMYGKNLTTDLEEAFEDARDAAEAKKYVTGLRGSLISELNADPSSYESDNEVGKSRPTARKHKKSSRTSNKPHFSNIEWEHAKNLEKQQKGSGYAYLDSVRREKMSLRQSEKQILTQNLEPEQETSLANRTGVNLQNTNSYIVDKSLDVEDDLMEAYGDITTSLSDRFKKLESVPEENRDMQWIKESNQLILDTVSRIECFFKGVSKDEVIMELDSETEKQLENDYPWYKEAKEFVEKQTQNPATPLKPSTVIDLNIQDASVESLDVLDIAEETASFFERYNKELLDLRSEAEAGSLAYKVYQEAIDDLDSGWNEITKSKKTLDDDEFAQDVKNIQIKTKGLIEDVKRKVAARLNVVEKGVSQEASPLGEDFEVVESEGEGDVLEKGKDDLLYGSGLPKKAPLEKAMGLETKKKEFHDKVRQAMKERPKFAKEIGKIQDDLLIELRQLSPPSSPASSPKGESLTEEARIEEHDNAVIAALPVKNKAVKDALRKHNKALDEILSRPIGKGEKNVEEQISVTPDLATSDPEKFAELMMEAQKKFFQEAIATAKGKTAKDLNLSDEEFMVFSSRLEQLSTIVESGAYIEEPDGPLGLLSTFLGEVIGQKYNEAMSGNRVELESYISEIERELPKLTKEQALEAQKFLAGIRADLEKATDKLHKNIIDENDWELEIKRIIKEGKSTVESAISEYRHRNSYVHRNLMENPYAHQNLLERTEDAGEVEGAGLEREAKGTNPELAFSEEVRKQFDRINEDISDETDRIVRLINRKPANKEALVEHLEKLILLNAFHEDAYTVMDDLSKSFYDGLKASDNDFVKGFVGRFEEFISASMQDRIKMDYEQLMKDFVILDLLRKVDKTVEIFDSSMIPSDVELAAKLVEVKEDFSRVVQEKLAEEAD